MGIWDDFKAGVGTLAGNIGDAVDNTFSQQSVEAYTPDKANFTLGGDPNYAGNTAAGLRQQGNQAGSTGQERASTFDQAAALGYQRGQDRAYTQTVQGQRGRDQAFDQGDAFLANGRATAGRVGPQVNLSGVQGDMANSAQSRDASMASANALTRYAQQGPGPSAAQAQMQQGQEASMASALALARSGRNGADASAERNAMFQNAATQQQTNQQLAQLRANEEATWRNQQLQALSGAGQAFQGVRGQDLQSQGLGLQTAQTDAQLQMQQRQLNDATALGYGGLANQSYGAGNQFDLGMQGLANQSLANGQQFYGQLGQLGNNAIQGGQQANLGFQGQANGVMGQQLAANMGYEGERGGNIMASREANAGFDAQRDQQNQGMMMAAAGALAMSDERMKTDIMPLEYQQWMQPQPQALPSYTAPVYTPPKSSGGGGMLGGMMGGMLSSDERSKTAIRNAEYAPIADASRNAHSQFVRIAPTPAGSPYPGDAPAPDRARGDDSPYAPISRASHGAHSQYVTYVTSDAHSKREIERLSSQLDEASALGYTPSRGSFARPDVRQPDRAALDYAQRSSGGRVYEPAVDLRPAQGYSYEYKDPNAPGAAPGRQFGPMAQDLEKTPAGASTVREAPDGTKMIDTPRLTMVNTAALSEQQRKTQELQAQVDALSGNSPRGVNLAALDEAYRRQGGRVMGPAYAPPTARFADVPAGY